VSKDRSTAIVRALGVPDPRLVESDALWTTQTTWPEQNPRAGQPVDQGDSDVVLAAYGARAGTATIETQCVSAGAIDPITGAGFAWKNSGDALYRGRNAPTSIWSWNAIHYTDGSSTTTGDVTASKAPHAATTSKRTVLVTSQVTRYGTGETVQVSRWVESTKTWSTANVLTITPAPSQAFEPALCVIPRTTGDRVLVFYWLEDTTTKTIQLGMSYSDDEGATWSVGSSACLKEPLFDGEVEGRRIRAAYRNGQVVLFAQLVGQDPADAAASNDFIMQWGSYDNGATFFVVKSGQNASATEGAFPDVVATPSGFLLAFVSIDRPSKVEPYIQQRIIPDAFTPFSASPRYVGLNDNVSGGTLVGYLQVANGDLGSAEIRHVPASGTIASSRYTYGTHDLSLVQSEDGTLYLITSAVSSYLNFSSAATTTYAKNEVVAVRSTDHGLNWETMGISDIFPVSRDAAGRPRANFPGSATIWRAQDTGSYLRSYAATWWKGQVVLAHQWLAATGNEDNSLCVAWLGGYSTVNMPRTELARNESTLAGWINTWLPIEKPGDLTSWTASGSAAELLVLASVRITASSGFRRYANTDASDGYIARASIVTASTSAIGSSRVGISLKVAGGVTHKHVEVRLSTSAIRLYDMIAGAAIGSDVSIDTTAGVDVVVSLQDGVAAMWYRARGASEDQEYIAGPTGTPSAGGSSTDEVAFGVLASDTATVRFHEMHVASGAYAGQHLETLKSMSNPNDLNAIRYSPTGTYLTDGVVLSARSGPAFEGDTHHIALASDYPVSRVFPAVFPSPRRGTRTVDDDSEAKIAVAYNVQTLVGGFESAPLSDAMCLAVLGANWRTGYVERYDRGTTSWVTLATIDAAEGMGWAANNWTRTGASIRADGPLGPTASQHYLEPNELAGGTVEFASNTLRKILSNTEGNTRGSLSGRQATLTFDTPSNTESTSIVRFWAPNFVVWWNMLGETAQGLRLRIPAQATVDGDLRVGTLVWANVHAFGTPYSFGRALGQEHGVQVVEAEDRTYRTRTLAPSRRSVTISWSDGVPTCNASGESPDPDYLKLSDSSGALPVASSFALPMTLRGLSEQVNGPALPVVYLPRLEKGPPDATTLNRRRDFLVGVIDSDIQLDTVQGSENEDEFIRVASLRIREVV
jgi:hypothetical protein